MSHALGIDPTSRSHPKRGGKPRNAREHVATDHRNYFATSDGDPEWESLVARGLAHHGRLINDPPFQLRYYHVTDEGKAALR